MPFESFHDTLNERCRCREMTCGFICRSHSFTLVTATLCPEEFMLFTTELFLLSVTQKNKLALPYPATGSSASMRILRSATQARPQLAFPVSAAPLRPPNSRCPAELAETPRWPRASPCRRCPGNSVARTYKKPRPPA